MQPVVYIFQIIYIYRYYLISIAIISNEDGNILHWHKQFLAIVCLKLSPLVEVKKPTYFSKVCNLKCCCVLVKSGWKVTVEGFEEDQSCKVGQYHGGLRRMMTAGRVSGFGVMCAPDRTTVVVDQNEEKEKRTLHHSVLWFRLLGTSLCRVLLLCISAVSPLNFCTYHQLLSFTDVSYYHQNPLIFYQSLLHSSVLEQ